MRARSRDGADSLFPYSDHTRSRFVFAAIPVPSLMTGEADGLNISAMFSRVTEIVIVFIGTLIAIGTTQRIGTWYLALAYQAFDKTSGSVFFAFAVLHLLNFIQQT